MAGWHYRLNGHEFEWTPGVGDGQGGLGCCNWWSRKESDTTEQLNWTEQSIWERGKAQRRKLKLIIVTQNAVINILMLIAIFIEDILFPKKYICGRVTPCCCVASVVSDSVRPHRWQPTRLPVPGILQARTLEWVAISFSNAWKWKVKSESEVAQSCPTLATPWTAAYQAPPSMGFSRQKYWSGVPLDLLNVYVSCGTSSGW